MRERGEVPDLGDQSDRGERVDAAHAAQPTHDADPPLGLRLLDDQRVETIATRQQHLVAGQVLAEHDLRQPIVKADRAQPCQVSLRCPWVTGAGEDQAAAQQQLADPVAGSHQIAAQILTRPDQVAQRFELERRDQHRPQLPRRVKSGELQRIPGVGLDLVARLTRDRAGRADITSTPSARA